MKIFRLFLFYHCLVVTIILGQAPYAIYYAVDEMYMYSTPLSQGNSTIMKIDFFNTNGSLETVNYPDCLCLTVSDVDLSYSKVQGGYYYGSNGINSGVRAAYTNMAKANTRELKAILTSTIYTNSGVQNEGAREDLTIFTDDNPKQVSFVRSYPQPSNTTLNFGIKGLFAMVSEANTHVKLISPVGMDPLRVTSKQVTLEAPAFMKDNFADADIVWYKDGTKLGTGPNLNVVQDLTISGICNVNKYEARIDKYNWVSVGLNVVFSPNIRLGTELLLTQPSCEVSQVGANPDLALGSFMLNTGNRGFAWALDGSTNPDLKSGEITSLDPGTHLLEFSEIFPDLSRSCPQTLQIAITPPTKLSYSQNILKDINCFGEKASYGIMVQGGTLPKDTLVLDNSSKFVADVGVVTTLNNISKGPHTLVLKDAKGCVHESPISFTVTEPPQLQANGSIVQPKCFGNNGQLSLAATGGTGTYTYSFNGQPQAGNTYTAKAGTTVSLGLSDSRGCTATVPSITVDSPRDFSFVLQSQKDNRCAGESKGEVVTLASSTDLSYSYTYSTDNINYNTSPNIKNLPSGSQTLYAKNNMGCTKQLTVSIGAPSAISLSVANNQPATCLGDKDGSIQVQVSGGAGGKTVWLDPKTPYKPVANAQAYSKDFTGLGSGNYKVYAMDDSLCQNTLDFSIGQQSNIYNSISKSQPSCSESTDGEIKLSTSGGIGPYRYNWSDRPTLANVSSPKSLGGGTYIVQVLDALNCEKRDTVTLNAPVALPVQLEGYPVLCKGQRLELDAGNPGNSYDWGSDNGLQAHTQKVTVTEAGTYYVKVSNTFGCTGKDTIKISQSTRSFEPDFLVASSALVDDIVTVIANNKDVNTLTLDWKVPSGSVRVLSTSGAAVQEYIFGEKGDYEIWLMAQDQECRAELKKTIHIYSRSQRDSLNNALGIDAELFRKVELFPNPTSGRFTLRVELDEARGMEVSLHSLASGALIQTLQLPAAEEQEHEFDQSLAEGLYVLYLKVGKETVSLRLFVAGDF